MNYVISSDEPAFVLRHARIAGGALIIAQDLAAEGRTDVKVTYPDGTALPLRQFAVLLRSESAQDAPPPPRRSVPTFSVFLSVQSRAGGSA